MYYHDKQTLLKLSSTSADTELIIKAYLNAILPMIRDKPKFDPIIVNKSLAIIRNLDEEIGHLHGLDQFDFFKRNGISKIGRKDLFLLRHQCRI